MLARYAFINFGTIPFVGATVAGIALAVIRAVGIDALRIQMTMVAVLAAARYALVNIWR